MYLTGSLKNRRGKKWKWTQNISDTLGIKMHLTGELATCHIFLVGHDDRDVFAKNLLYDGDFITSLMKLRHIINYQRPNTYFAISLL